MAEKEDDNNKKKSHSGKRVVVTYGEKKKKKEDIPVEILPQTPKAVVADPIDSGFVPDKLNPSLQKSFKSQLHTKIPEEIAPRVAVYSSQKENSKETSTASASFPQQGRSASMPPASPTASKGSTASSFLSILTVGIIILLIGSSYYLHQQLIALQQQAQNNKTSVAALVSEAKSELSQLQILQNEHQTSQKKLNALQGQIEQSQTQLISLAGNKNWVVSEINSLILMAYERLQVARDIPTAIMQLRTAQTRINTLGDPSLIELKQAIAEDIATLGSHPLMDKQALWMEIGSMYSKIEKLNFKSINQQNVEKKDSLNDQPSWKKALWQSWLELKSLIQITKEAQNPIPQALSLQEKMQILRTLQLLDEQARWAVFQGNNQIYLNSLVLMQQNIQSYFVDTPFREEVLQQINKLQQQSVSYPHFEIAKTLQALSKIIEMQGLLPSRGNL